MSRRAALNVVLFCTVLPLASCGVTYTSPSVIEESAGSQVRVVPLTRETVLLANRSPYAPRSLPDAFFQAAGGGNLRGAGALPELPYMPQQERRALELRLPPPLPPVPYRIGVGDVLLLATRAGGSSVEQLSGLLAAQNQRQGFTVRDDGAIAIPDIGQIRLEGLTLEEAEMEIFQRLIDHQVDPAFSLEVAEFNSKRVSVGGAVGAATLVPITLNTLDLGEALTAAGGVTVRDQEFASIRLYRDGTLYQIPIDTFFSRPELQNLALRAGDAIYVDTTYDLDRALAFYEAQINVISLRSSARSTALAELQAEIGIRRGALAEMRENFNSRAALGAEARDYVYLAGEVNSQSRFALPYGQQASLADVLYENGGFSTITGNPAQIYVLRASGDPSEFGATTAWHLDARNAANLTLATALQMRPNDIIFIEEQPITKWNRALQQFFPVLLSTASRAVN